MDKLHFENKKVGNTDFITKEALFLGFHVITTPLLQIELLTEFVSRGRQSCYIRLLILPVGKRLVFPLWAVWNKTKYYHHHSDLRYHDSQKGKNHINCGNIKNSWSIYYKKTTKILEKSVLLHRMNSRGEM